VARIKQFVQWIVVSPVPLLLISVALNVSLAAKLVMSREAVRALKAEGRLAEGARVPDLDLSTVSGEKVAIRYADSSTPTLLYVMTPTCGWCKRNVDNLRHLVDNASGRYRVFIVSLSPKDVAHYSRTHSLAAPVLINIPADAVKSYKLGGTPHTILVSPKGTVLKNWMGAYTGPLVADIEETLQVRLPGLREPAPAGRP
jgi:hypothetical protein